MSNAVVHVEVIGSGPDALRSFYAEVFGWSAEAGAPVSSLVSRPDAYAFNEPGPSAQAVPVGIGGGPDFRPRVVVYVGVDDVAASLRRAVDLGASVVLEPSVRPDGGVQVAQFADPEGNVVGLAGPV